VAAVGHKVQQAKGANMDHREFVALKARRETTV
jgi:hypothetical protein